MKLIENPHGGFPSFYTGELREDSNARVHARLEIAKDKEAALALLLTNAAEHGVIRLDLLKPFFETPKPAGRTVIVSESIIRRLYELLPGGGQFGRSGCRVQGSENNDPWLEVSTLGEPDPEEAKNLCDLLNGVEELYDAMRIQLDGK